MVRKHTYARPVPDSPADLVDWIDSEAGARYSIAPGEVFAEYARRVMARDPGLREQVREQVAVSRSAMAAGAGEYREDAPGCRADGVFGSSGEFFRAIWPHRTPGPDLSAKLRELRSIQASFGSEIPGDGGFLVPEEWRAEVMALAVQDAVVRPRATVVPMGSLRLNFPVTDATSNVSSIFGGFVAYWTEEAASITESQASFAVAGLNAKALKAFMNAPNELVADAPAFSQFIRSVVPRGVAWYEDAAFLAGTGAGEPLGFVGCPAQIQVPKESGQAAATVVWENVTKMFARMLPGSIGRAVWICSIDAYTELATMALSVGTGGGPVWSADGSTLMMLGRPVLFHEALPVLGTPGDVNFVDLSAYLIGDRAVMQADTSPHLKFAMDVTSIRIRHRVDGRPALQSAVLPRNGGSNTVSAYVTIAAR